VQSFATILPTISSPYGRQPSAAAITNEFNFNIELLFTLVVYVVYFSVVSVTILCPDHSIWKLLEIAFAITSQRLLSTNKCLPC
jgi:hypothetical protein